MIRFGILFTLLLSFFFLLRENLQILQQTQPLHENVAKPRKPKPVVASKQVRFYPDVPFALPDLSAGYMFNEKRTLGEDSAPVEEPVAETPPPTEEEPAIDAEQVTFIGSIITDKIRQAMVTYIPAPDVVPPPPPPVPGAVPGQPPGRTPNRPPGAAAILKPPPAPVAGAGEVKNALINEGEDFHGYTVVSVLPDKLILSRGGQEIVRTLFDAQKKRQAPPPPAPRPAPRQAAVPPQPGQPPQPGGQPGQPARRQAPVANVPPQPGQPAQPGQPGQQAAPGGAAGGGWSSPGGAGVTPPSTRRHGGQSEVIQRRRMP